MIVILQYHALKQSTKLPIMMLRRSLQSQQTFLTHSFLNVNQKFQRCTKLNSYLLQLNHGIQCIQFSTLFYFYSIRIQPKGQTHQSKLKNVDQKWSVFYFLIRISSVVSKRYVNHHNFNSMLFEQEVACNSVLLGGLMTLQN